MIFEVGRVCVKIAGRDAGQKCVVVEIIDNNFVLIDGMTRRRKCNTNHLEALNEIVKIKAGASKAEVGKALGIELVETKPKKAAEKPMKVRTVKEAPVKVAAKKAPAKKAAKKEEAKAPVKEEKATPKKAPAKKATKEE